MRLAGKRLTATVAALALASCGGGGGGNNGGNPPPVGGGGGGGNPPPVGGLFTAPPQESLSVAEVQQIIAQAAGEAAARGLAANIAVTDRVGNVLAVFQMPGAPGITTVSRQSIGGVNANPVGIQGFDVPATTAAIAKAVTGAYLSSGGNAFSTRTASQIVQEHFPPAPNTAGLESGPLFGVQFSQLPCSDLSQRFTTSGGPGAMIGPKRSPLGLSADAGGLPIYKNGTVVGGIGVEGDGVYGADFNILDVDNSAEEFAALAGIQGFEPPVDIRADRINVDGTSLRFSDATAAGLGALQTSFAGTAGNLVVVAGYTDGTIRAGTAYGSEASGIRASRPTEFTNPDAFVLTDGAGNNRFPIRGGTDAAAVGTALTADEVRAVLEEAFIILSRARAQIRRPLDSRMQATISLVDTNGVILGIVRSPDGPIFGTDVSLQKARTAALFSNTVAAADLNAAGPTIANYVTRARTFLNDPNALTGTFAFADRSGGNLSRPYFPDGEVGTPPGPFSVEQSEDFSPFAVGLQLDLVAGDLIEHLTFVATNGGSPDVQPGCTGLPNTSSGLPRVANGIQIFPGSVPIYRGNQLVGGIGVSGDGIDQDDMVSFLGLHNGGQRVGGIGNAPNDIRADRIVVNVNGQDVRLRYVNCPFAPFLDTTEQNVCQGL